MLEVRNVTKTYRMGETIVHALRGVSVTIEEGDFVAIMGPSGSGKSTLMNLLGLLDVPSMGSYSIDGREVAGLSEDDLAVLRRKKIGFIFQQFNLLPRLSAVENVALPQQYTGPTIDEERARTLLGQVGLGKRLDHKTNELSGGQQQRVAIARALMNQPQIIFADEPTGNLDSASEHEIMGILRSLNDQGMTLVMVTHEEEIGAQARRRIRMRDGVIISDERLDPRPLPKLKNRPQTASSDAEADTSALSSSLVSAASAMQLLKQGFKTLAANKVRASLSMLGILIGVAAVIAMLAIGRGAQEAIEAQLSSLGSNLLVLSSATPRVAGVNQESGASRKLTLLDADAIRSHVMEAKDIAPVVSGRGQLEFRDRNWNTQIMGTGPAYARMHSAEPLLGRFFTSDEDQKRARVAVLGATVAKELFGASSPIGENIRIDRVIFQVIGVLPVKGSSGSRDQDDVVVIPTLTALYRLLGRTTVDSIEVEVKDAASMDPVQARLTELVRIRHKIPPSMTGKAFYVRNMANVRAATMESNRTMSILLASIAGISLLVGGIGIMNIMLVSVTERTREVGLRKAIGARPHDIHLQFLFESIVVSSLGGLIGIVLGWLITTILSVLFGWNTSISFGSIGLSVCFSAGVGIAFGIYPARKAAALNPIEALRYD